MVKYHGVRLNHIFGVLADPTRRAILRRLAGGEATISELAEPYEMSLPAISKHLRVMEEAGLVQRRKEGRSWRCRLVAAPLKEATDWLDFYRHFWRGQLDSVADYLRETQPDQPQETTRTKPSKTSKTSKTSAVAKKSGSKGDKP